MGKEYAREITVMGSVPHLGPVLLYDDMESLFKWVKAGGAGDSVFEKSDTVAYNGTSSMHMKTRATDAAENDEIAGWRDTFLRPGKRYRVECLFMPDASGQSKFVLIEPKIWDGTTYHLLGVRWDEAGSKWQYRAAGPVWSDIPGGGQTLVADQFSRMLLEWDQNLKTYSRLVCQGLEIDMSGLGYSYVADGVPTLMRLDLGMTAGAAPPGEVYFDEVLVMEI